VAAECAAAAVEEDKKHLKWQNEVFESEALLTKCKQCLAFFEKATGRSEIRNAPFCHFQFRL
jgi:hypothetical protein